jgi:hypothetical protein
MTDPTVRLLADRLTNRFVFEKSGGTSANTTRAYTRDEIADLVEQGIIIYAQERGQVQPQEPEGADGVSRASAGQAAQPKSAPSGASSISSGEAKHTALRELAEAATPGRWKPELRVSNYCRIVSADDPEICIAETGSWAPKYFDEMVANAAFIAAANPKAILELLAERDAAVKREAELVKALEEVRDYFDQRADISAKNENAPNEEMRLLASIDEALSTIAPAKD